MSVPMLDVRCPVTPRRLFARLAAGTFVEGNLIEVACDACRKTVRQMGSPCTLVLHRYNALGECIETDVVP